MAQLNADAFQCISYCAKWRQEKKRLRNNRYPLGDCVCKATANPLDASLHRLPRTDLLACISWHAKNSSWVSVKYWRPTSRMSFTDAGCCWWSWLSTCLYFVLRRFNHCLYLHTSRNCFSFLERKFTSSGNKKIENTNKWIQPRTKYSMILHSMKHEDT